MKSWTLTGHALQVMSGYKASTSGRLPSLAPVARFQYKRRVQPVTLSARKSCSIYCTPGCKAGTVEIKRICPVHFRLVTCQAQNSQQESERPVMEQMESDLIAGGSGDSTGNGARSNGDRAPLRNAATNAADKSVDRPAEESHDEGDNNDAGAQSHSERSGGAPAKAANKLPGGVTDSDNVSAPKPASFWLPHPEPGDHTPVSFKAFSSLFKHGSVCYA